MREEHCFHKPMNTFSIKPHHTCIITLRYKKKRRARFLIIVILVLCNINRQSTYPFVISEINFLRNNATIKRWNEVEMKMT